MVHNQRRKEDRERWDRAKATNADSEVTLKQHI